LPEFYHQSLANEFLRAYVGTYLQEEIQAESLTRNLPGFSRFLEVCALNNGAEIVYANISQETGVKSRTLENYFSILSDTLIGFQVPGFTATQKRKAIARSKHFFLMSALLTHWPNAVRSSCDPNYSVPRLNTLSRWSYVLIYRIHATRYN
jgi:predicted AAA+ superfamily ATPase